MATVYINPTGDDTTGAGTSVSPWKTISKANTSSSSGDTIFCQPGTFTWVDQDPFSNGDRFITADSPTTTIFDASSADLVWKSGGPILTISNITFQHARVSGTLVCIFDSHDSGAFNFTNCIFNDLFTVRNNTGLFGNNSNSTTSGISLISCTLNACGSSSTSSAYFNIGGGPATLLTVTMYNNTIYSNLTNPNTASFHNESGNGNIVFVMKNNIIFNANGTPKGWASASGGATQDLYTGSVASSNDIVGYSSIPAGLTGNLSSDPLFVDASGGNFNLRPTSPCIDAGVII